MISKLFQNNFISHAYYHGFGKEIIDKGDWEWQSVEKFPVGVEEKNTTVEKSPKSFKSLCDINHHTSAVWQWTSCRVEPRAGNLADLRTLRLYIRLQHQHHTFLGICHRWRWSTMVTRRCHDNSEAAAAAAKYKWFTEHAFRKSDNRPKWWPVDFVHTCISAALK